MKKALVLALAAITLAGTAAHAAQGKPGRGLRALEGMKTREADRVNARNSAPTVTANAATTNVRNSITSSGLRVSSQTTEAIAANIANPIVKRGYDAAIANKNAAPELATAQLNALSLLPSAQGTAAGKEIFTDLVVGAGAKAAKWPDAKAKGNVQFMIERTAEYMNQKKSVDEALRLAKEDLHKEKGVDIELAKIKELCK